MVVKQSCGFCRFYSIHAPRIGPFCQLGSFTSNYTGWMFSLKPVHVIATLLALLSILSLLAAKRCLVNYLGQAEYRTLLFAILAAQLTLLMGWLAVSRWKAIPALLIFLYCFFLNITDVFGSLGSTGSFAVAVFLTALFGATAVTQLCVPGVLHPRHLKPAFAGMRVTLLDMMLWAGIAAGLVTMTQHMLPSDADAVRRGVMAGMFAALIATLHLHFLWLRMLLLEKLKLCFTFLFCTVPAMVLVVYVTHFPNEPLVWQPFLFELVFSTVLLLSIACFSGSQPSIKVTEDAAEASSANLSEREVACEAGS
jgi:hypothetical protein